MKVALLIGINYTKNELYLQEQPSHHIPEYTLQSSIDDMNTMKHILISNYGYVESNIFTLRDDDLTKMPTRDSILKALNDLIVGSKSYISYTEVCIHYCGHGSHIQNYCHEIPKIEGIIIPSDYKTQGFIEDDVIFKCISFIQCPVLLIIDTSHSGNMCDLEYGFTNRFINQKIIKNPNIIMFSGSNSIMNMEGTVSCDYTSDVFTNSLLQSLKNNGYYKTQIGQVNKQNIYEWLRQNGKNAKIEPCSQDNQHILDTTTNTSIIRELPLDTITKNELQSTSLVVDEQNYLSDITDVNTMESSKLTSIQIIQRILPIQLADSITNNEHRKSLILQNEWINTSITGFNARFSNRQQKSKSIIFY